MMLAPPHMVTMIDENQPANHTDWNPIETTVYSDPLAFLEATFAKNTTFKRDDKENLFKVYVPQLGSTTMFSIPINEHRDAEWHHQVLARKVLSICPTPIICTRMIMVAAQRGIVDESLLTLAERGIRNIFSIENHEPYQISTERLVQLVMIKEKLTETDTAPQLQTEAMAPRKPLRGQGSLPQMFRCNFLHKGKRADSAAWCTSVVNAERLVLTQLLVGLIELK
jgi:hypothetical protein